jgi:hypothetical protein
VPCALSLSTSLQEVRERSGRNKLEEQKMPLSIDKIFRSVLRRNALE